MFFFVGEKNAFLEEKKSKKRKRRKISGEGKRIFCKENENEEGKVDIHFKRKQYFCGGEEKKTRKKRRKILGEGNFLGGVGK